MNKASHATVLAAMIAAPVLAASVDRAPLAPSSPWNVNYADDYCRLIRAFGTGAETSFVVFDRFAPGQGFKLVVAGRPVAKFDRSTHVQLRFGPNEEVQDVAFFMGDLGKGRPALVFRHALSIADSRQQQGASESDLPQAISPERFAAVRELVVGTSSPRPVRLALGSLRGPFAALDKCIDNLVVRWGLDPAQQAALSRRVVPIENPARWITSNDYPASAIFSGAQGLVEFRLTVDERGTPSGCHIQQSTRPPEFDETVCRSLMKRARFVPALDRDGKPIASFYRSTVVFVMP